MKECLSEDILQQYFDGELPGGRMEAVASHLAGCDVCTASFEELESESNLLMSALAPEFDGAIPTERLNRRIQAAISGLQVVSPVYARPSASGWRSWFQSVSSLVSPQRAFAYGGLAAVLAVVAMLAIVRLQGPAAPPANVAVVQEKPSESGQQKDITPPAPKPAPTSEVQTEPKQKQTEKTAPVQKLNRKTPRALVPDLRDTVAVKDAVKDDVKLLPGERSYLKTIAALDTTIKSGKKTMRPALQAEYERNLALVDRAIAATRSAAKRNPNDPDAAEFMFSAYQSKVDLLNTIADARVYNQPR
jgi:hypothetical protein